MSMFENYATSTRYTDNRAKTLPNCDENYEIITVGAKCKNVFKIPFRFDALADFMKVFYKQGIDHTMVVDEGINEIKIYPAATTSIIEIDLSADFTSRFKETLLNTVCQFEYWKDGQIIGYSDEYPVKVIAPINCGENDINNSEVK